MPPGQESSRSAGISERERPADSVCVFKLVPACHKSAQIVQSCSLTMRQTSAQITQGDGDGARARLTAGVRRWPVAALRPVQGRG
jgi:hypothetical protein